MPRRTQKAIVSALAGYGLHFRSLTVSTDGEYPVADADWNYKDVPHVNYVHHLTEDVNGVTDPDAESSVNLQKVLGIRMPIVLSHYDSAPNRQTYFFTVLMYAVVCETTFEDLPDGGSRVITNYAVGASRVFMLAFPLIVWMLRRNYRVLMNEDIPLRTRRVELRKWGYRFRGDGQPRSFVDSLAIERDSVELADVPEPAPLQVPLARLQPGEPYLWGRDDHLGLRIERVADEIQVFPRICLHEGASLDTAERSDACLGCPWHGRRVATIARLSLAGAGGAAETEHHRIAVEGDELVVRVRSASLDDTHR